VEGTKVFEKHIAEATLYPHDQADGLFQGG
jgi:hypothetical protein